MEKKSGFLRIDEDQLEQAVGGVTVEEAKTVKAFCPTCKKTTTFIVYHGSRATCRGCGKMTEI